MAAQPAPAPRTLLIISAEVRPELQHEIDAGRYPRKDYFELARALQADILDWSATQKPLISRLLARFAGTSVAQAWLAFRLRQRYDVIYSDSERIGIPLALLLKLACSRQRHIMLAHMLSPWKKRVWFRWGRIHTQIDKILCHSSLQRQIMIDESKISANKIALIPYQADERFWQPMPVHSSNEFGAAGVPPSGPSAGTQACQGEERPGSGTGGPGPLSADLNRRNAAPEQPLICSVGLEFRDYPTLIEAVCGLDVQLEIAAASFWSDHHGISASKTLPPNVRVRAHPYLSLRQLYAASRFVVVPLVEVSNQAGITVILEAMAMGKAVIVSGTRGQTDTVRDRRNNGYGRIERRVLPGFLDAPDVPEQLKRLPTGFYVQPGDPEELRKAIAYLLAHPDLADELGRNGRQVVETVMGLDAFVARIAQIVNHRPGSPGEEPPDERGAGGQNAPASAAPQGRSLPERSSGR